MRNRNIPENAIHATQLTESVSPIKKCIETSSHQVDVKQLKDNSIWLYKLNNPKSTNGSTDHKGCEFEAAIGALYRILIGDRAPVTRGVVDDGGERKGVASEAIEGYASFLKTSIKQQLSSIHKRSNLSKECFLEGNIARVLVAAYVFEENDLHLGNIGFRADGKVVKIDHDQSLYSLTQKYANLNNSSRYNVDIHAADIESFPNLKLAKPRRWVIVAMRTEALSQIHHEKAFNNEKYFYFLKSILISPHSIHAIAQSNFSTLFASARFTGHLLKRLAKLKKELLEVPAFRQFLIDNPSIDEQLIAEFDTSEHAYVQRKLTALRHAVMSYGEENSNKEKTNPCCLFAKTNLCSSPKIDSLFKLDQQAREDLSTTNISYRID